MGVEERGFHGMGGCEMGVGGCRVGVRERRFRGVGGLWGGGFDGPGLHADPASVLRSRAP